MEKAALKELFANGNIPAGTEYKAALTGILQTFPYFQLAQVLLAKQMYDSHEPEAAMRIKLASVYAPDRKAMYQLFKSQNVLQELQRPPIATQKPQANTTGKEGVKYNFVYSSTTIKKPETFQTAPVEKTTKDSGQTETFILRESETKLPPVVTSEKIASAPVQKEEKPATEIKKTESVAPPLIKKLTPFTPLEKKVEKPLIQAIKPITPVEKAATDKKTIPLKPTITEQPVVPVKNSQTPVEAKKPEPFPTVEPIAESRLKYSFGEWLKALPEINNVPADTLKPVNQKEKSDIISSFLENLPTISRPKAEFFSPVKAAKLSITENDEIVSETLADIYLKQGNLQKAVKAYETLLSQFPEKKNIFAARIEEIRALIRENIKK